MKPASRLSDMIEEKRQKLTQQQGTPKQAPKRSWLRWAVPLLCVLVSGGGTFALFEYVILSKLPRELLGKWVVIEGEMEGATAEFSRNGTTIWKVNMKGKEGIIKGRAEVDGETMRIMTTNPMTKEPVTDTQTILTLNENQLVIEDQKGTIIKLERLRE